MPSPRSYRYRVVDVFTTQPLEGNPLAVFPEASGLELHGAGGADGIDVGGYVTPVAEGTLKL